MSLVFSSHVSLFSHVVLLALSCSCSFFVQIGKKQRTMAPVQSKPSPFGSAGGGKKSKRRIIDETDFKSNDTSYVKFYHVKPPGSMGKGYEGVIVRIDGKHEPGMTAPFYNKETEEHQWYIKELQPVTFAFKIKDENGDIMKEYGKTGIGYEKKCMCVIFDDPEHVGKEQVKEWFDAFLVPTMKRMTTWYHKGELLWNDESYELHEKPWSAFLTKQDIARFLSQGCVDKKDASRSSPAAVLKQDKFNLYSFWNVGELPAEVYKQYFLQPKHVDPSDIPANKIAASDSYDSTDHNGNNNGASRSVGNISVKPVPVAGQKRDRGDDKGSDGEDTGDASNP